MKDKKTSLWTGAFTAIVGMSLSKMPYPIVSIAVGLIVIVILYSIYKLQYSLKGEIKKNWAWFAMFVSVFIGVVFLFLNRTAEEFGFLLSIKNLELCIALIFIVLSVVFGYLILRPHLKKIGGFANMMEYQNPGSWMMIKIIFWFVIACLVFLASIFIWEHFFE